MVELFDVAVEEQILGAILVDPQAMSYIADTLKAEHFYREKNMWVYDAMLSLYNNNKVVDQITVAHELSELKRIEAIGGVAYLSHLVAETATSVHIEYHAGIIRNLASRRAIRLASAEIEKLAEKEDVDEAYADALSILMKIQTGTQADKLWFPKERAEFALERYSKLQKEYKNAIVTFGIKFLDKLGGMQGGNTIVIAGPSGKGKTTLACQIATHVARVHGPVLFVSLEMSEEETTDRDMARLTETYVLEIMRGNYSEPLMEQIMDAIGPLSEEGVVYTFPPSCTVPNIYAKARRMQIQCGLSMVVIDYIQLLKDAEGGRNMDEQLTNISHGIKRMARELNVPVVALSQENRDRNAPIIDRTRGSGTITHDCSWLLYLERDEDDSELSKLTIAKQRQGGAETEESLRYIWKRQLYVPVDTTT